MSELLSPDSGFAEIVQIIASARQRAFQAVNTQLIDLYWQVGEYISRKIERAEWGDGVVAQLADYLARTQPGLRGFTRRNLFRMRQFYEAYRDDEKVSPLVTQLPWTHHLIILGQSKLPEERDFYLRMAVQERWSKRELERQINAALFERAVLNPAKASASLAERHSGVLSLFKDACMVEYALSRTLSPALIAEYQTQLPDKKLLQAKLHEFYALNAPEEEGEA